jgi:hypothetical protein
LECWDCVRKRIHPDTEVVNKYVIVAPCVMNQRFVAAIIVALAVLSSQAGGSVLAAICPHLRSPHNASCNEAPPNTSVVHHQMDNANGDAVFETEETAASCNHCAVHSRTKRDDSARQSTDSVQRASDPSVADAFSAAGPPSLVRTVTWFARAHGPPGNAGPLHLLLKVFRI